MAHVYRMPLTLVLVCSALAGCNTPSMDEFRALENEVADLRVRLETAETRADESALSATSALDSAAQCNDVCLDVSNRLDELYLEGDQTPIR